MSLPGITIRIIHPQRFFTSGWTVAPYSLLIWLTSCKPRLGDDTNDLLHIVASRFAGLDHLNLMDALAPHKQLSGDANVKMPHVTEVTQYFCCCWFISCCIFHLRHLGDADSSVIFRRHFWNELISPH